LATLREFGDIGDKAGSMTGMTARVVACMFQAMTDVPPSAITL
jgi:hypothetical protein